MNKKSLIQVTFSIMLALVLVITTVTIFPRVASAQDTSNIALEALKRGIELYEQGDCDKAESSREAGGDCDKAESLYQEAIDRAEAEVEVFIAAKQRLAKIKQSQGKTEEANKLYEESLAGITALGTIPEVKLCDTSCPTCMTTRCRKQGSGCLTTCQPCGL